MRKVTSVTVWPDAVGTRMSVTYTEIDEETGQIVASNKRVDRVLTEASQKSHATGLFNAAQTFVEGLE